MRAGLSDFIDEWGFFTPVPEMVIERMAALGPDAFAVFCHLRYRTHRERRAAWPSYDDMASGTGMSRERIAAGLRTLEAAGFLERTKRFGQSTVYRLRPPEDVAVGSPSSRPVRRLADVGGPPVVGQSDASSRPVRLQSSDTPTAVVALSDGIQDSSIQDSPIRDGMTQEAASSPPRPNGFVRCEICGFMVSPHSLGMRCEGAHFTRTKAGKVGVAA